MASPEFLYRLITRSDFDGLASGALLRELRMLDDILFVHPRDLQNGLVAVTGSDIIANLPYHPGCHLCFDHHGSEAIRSGHHVRQNYVLDPDADSAARVIYRYYGGAAAFPGIGRDMMEAVDKCDAARFSREEILAPAGSDLLIWAAAVQAMEFR